MINKLLFILFGLMFISFSFVERDITVNGILYSFPWEPRGGYGCVSDISGRSGNMAIVQLQTEVEGRDVKVINVFESSDTLLRKLVVPKGYTLVERFWNFQNLDTVVLPSSLKSITPNSFMGCEHLKAFLFAKRNRFLKFKDGCLIRTKDSALLYSLNGSSVPSKTRIICEGAFANRRDTSVIFISNSVVSIMPNAFGTNSSIKEVVFSHGNENFIFSEGNIITKKDSTLVCLLGAKCNINSNVKILCDWLFYRSECIDTICIPEGVTRIGRHCFDRSSLSCIYLPNSLIGIGYDAFDCTNITSLNIPEGVENLDNDIGCCTKLESVSIPKSMKVVPQSVFGGCHHIKVVYMHSRNTKIEEGAFPPDAEIKYVDE